MPETATRPQLAYLTAALDELKAKGTHFRLRVLEDQQAPVCHYDGREVINLASNNYLGLANHPKLIEAAIAATRTYGVRRNEKRVRRFMSSSACEKRTRFVCSHDRLSLRAAA